VSLLQLTAWDVEMWMPCDCVRFLHYCSKADEVVVAAVVVVVIPAVGNTGSWVLQRKVCRVLKLENRTPGKVLPTERCISNVVYKHDRFKHKSGVFTAIYCHVVIHQINNNCFVVSRYCCLCVNVCDTWCLQSLAQKPRMTKSPNHLWPDFSRSRVLVQ